MAIVFWDSRVLLTYYITKSVNLNSVYYCKILCELKANIRRKWSNLRNKQIFFIRDNARPHASEFIVAFLDELGWFIFLHLAYLPDLAPVIFGYFHVSKISWWPAFCKWFTSETSSCRIFPRLFNDLLRYRNWTSCRSIWKMSQFWYWLCKKIDYLT